MVWIKLYVKRVSTYVDVTKICAITSFIDEKKSDVENHEYILEGTIYLHSIGFFSTPIMAWDYNMGIPKINNKIKNPEKLKKEIDKWKHQAFQKAKFKHDQRVFKVVHCLEEIKNQKEKHVAFDFMVFFNKIDSVDL